MVEPIILVTEMIPEGATYTSPLFLNRILKSIGEVFDRELDQMTLPLAKENPVNRPSALTVPGMRTKNRVPMRVMIGFEAPIPFDVVVPTALTTEIRTLP